VPRPSERGQSARTISSAPSARLQEAAALALAPTEIGVDRAVEGLLVQRRLPGAGACGTPLVPVSRFLEAPRR
jgi:hypothetical protein